MNFSTAPQQVSSNEAFLLLWLTSLDVRPGNAVAVFRRRTLRCVRTDLQTNRLRVARAFQITNGAIDALILGALCFASFADIRSAARREDSKTHEQQSGKRIFQHFYDLLYGRTRRLIRRRESGALDGENSDSRQSSKILAIHRVLAIGSAWSLLIPPECRKFPPRSKVMYPEAIGNHSTLPIQRGHGRLGRTSDWTSPHDLRERYVCPDASSGCDDRAAARFDAWGHFVGSQPASVSFCAE